jgi:hypothetical protein
MTSPCRRKAHRESHAGGYLVGPHGRGDPGPCDGLGLAAVVPRAPGDAEAAATTAPIGMGKSRPIRSLAVRALPRCFGVPLCPILPLHLRSPPSRPGLAGVPASLVDGEDTARVGRFHGPDQHAWRAAGLVAWMIAERRPVPAFWVAVMWMPVNPASSSR